MIDRFRRTAIGPFVGTPSRRDAFDAVRALRARGGDDVLRGGWCVISIENFFVGNTFRARVGTRRRTRERMDGWMSVGSTPASASARADRGEIFHLEID